LLSSLRLDVTYAVRSFLKTPSLTVTIIISIALGIGANTMVFSIVNELLVRDLPVRDPSQLYVMEPAGRPSSSFPAYLDFRDQTDNIFEGLAAHSLIPVAANISTGGGAQRVWGLLVSGNYFQVTGAPILLGRGIIPSEDQARVQNAVVVLGYGLWRNLGADPEIVGKHIVLSGAPYTVVGVAAPGFFGTDRGILSEFWAPLGMRTHLAQDVALNYMNRNCSWLEMTGRLRPGVSRQQAVAAANVVYARMHAQYEKGRTFEPVGLFRVGYLPILQAILQPLMMALSIVVGLLLLLACANVANLLLARAASREQEIGVRLALGASRGRVVRQLLSESVLLSGTGALLGFVLAVPGTAALAKVQPPLGIPIRFDFSPDVRVLSFTAALAVLTGILFGLAPAFTATRGTIMSAMRQGARGGNFNRGRLMQILVGLQVALSLILLIAAGLFLRSLQEAASIDVGLKGNGALMMAVDPKGQGYSQERMKRFFSDLQQRVEAIPGVKAIGYVDLPPLSLAVSNADFYDADSAESKRAAGDTMRVSAHYFAATGISLLAGRDFDPQRDENSAVAIINQETAHRLFGAGNPIGRHIREGGDPGTGNVYEVIGLVRNAKVETLGEGDVPCMFRYLSDFEGGFSLYGVTMIARSSGDPGQLATAVQREISNLDRELPLFNVKTLDRHINDALLLPRVSGALFGLFGSVGLILALVGVYGVVNYSVRTRTREIGIRMALGASPLSVAGSIVNRGLALVGAGLGLGLVVALMLSRFTASQLYGVSPTDPVTFFGVPVILFAASLAALLIPACRAARIEPMTALRDE
jgi:putative ABC transport system permease protein